MADPRPIPFGNLLSSGQEELAGASPASINVSVDDTGTVRRRPGIQTHSSVPSTAIVSGLVDGMHVTPAGGVYACGYDGNPGTRDVYRISGGVGSVLGTLSGGRRAIFATTDALVVIANGDLLYKVDLSTYAFAALGGTPPKGSHVLYNASRLLANDVTLNLSRVYFTSPASGTVITGHEDWSSVFPAGFFTAEARPDPVVAIGENSNEIFVWGSTNLEIYQTDPLFGFSRVATRDYGCSAPYSVVPFDNTFVWLDEQRRIVQSDGRSVTPISNPIGAVLKGLSSVSDCYGYRVSAGRTDHLVWTFPAAKLTLAMQVGGGWAQWAQQSKGQWQPFPVTAHAHDPTMDTNFVGLSDGKVAQLSDGVIDDLGTPIAAHVESGFQDHGTSRWKENLAVRLTLRRGAKTGSTPLLAFLQWQDRPGAWTSPRAVYLGDSGETNPVVTLRALGSYRQRNWRFLFSDDADLALVKAEEDFELVKE